MDVVEKAMAMGSEGGGGGDGRGGRPWADGGGGPPFEGRRGQMWVGRPR